MVRPLTFASTSAITSITSGKSSTTLFSNASPPVPKKENIDITSRTTTTTEHVSYKLEKENSITTATTTESSSSEIFVAKTLLADESEVATTKVYVIVFVVVITVLGCFVVWAYIVHKKKKRNVVLPTVVYRNEQVVIPDLGETPIRARIDNASRNFLPLSYYIDFRRFGRPRQQFQDIELEHIQFMVPDFTPFPGFDLDEFRKILADVRSRPLLQNSARNLSNNPDL
jgi:hypothetical protein